MYRHQSLDEANEEQAVQKYKRDSRQKRERFRKRKISIFKKAFEVSEIFSVDVYVAIRRGERYFTYSSSNESRWPDREEIVSLAQCIAFQSTNTL